MVSQKETVCVTGASGSSVHG
uniref:Mutant protein of dihydroflavonol reductase n=1 Tax=Arabidopsis thaliana TaxID=3702 RepID=Q5DWV8_ARATH|nr:mutant protein of dihydroflavonol reductase [Arabidopsis thaliana]